MFGTILVPLDGSREAELAIPFACDEADRHTCKVVLVRVVPRPELPALRVSHGGPASTGPLWAATDLIVAKDDAIAYLRDVIRRHGLPLDTEIITPVGDPFTRLQEEIERRATPLVVLAAETETGSLANTFGETSRRLLLSGSAPVLRIRGPRHVSPASVGHAAVPAFPRAPLDDVTAAATSWA